ncbi:hypothetical protein NKJ64_14180 [Mesorhizobium sp. M0062]|uniref:hypothetical protein n=1 Tax=Mesorhizobium sp. M0062 TaxID=2956867 RepID=UPI003335378E
MIDDVETSPALDTRLGSLRARMRDARITEADMKTFQKVASIMVGGSGRISGDDLIAASFVLEGQPEGL